MKRGVGIGRYLRRAFDVLNGTKSTEGEQVQMNDTIVIKGVSNAMESVVKLAELVKHRVKGLY